MGALRFARFIAFLGVARKARYTAATKRRGVSANGGGRENSVRWPLQRAVVARNSFKRTHRRGYDTTLGLRRAMAQSHRAARAGIRGRIRRRYARPAHAQVCRRPSPRVRRRAEPRVRWAVTESSRLLRTARQT